MAEEHLLLLFIFFSIAISISDIRTGTVPRLIFFIAFPLCLGLIALKTGKYAILLSFTGAMLGLTTFLAVYFMTNRKLGLADVWYSALIGLILGPWWWYAAIGSACLAGVVYILILKQRSIPFIPFMALGSIAVSIIR